MSGAAAFEAVFEQGTRREGRYVQLISVRATTSATGRFGFIVARKAIRRAVDRNRFKRVVRARLRASGDAANYDIVIRVKRPVARVAIDEAAAEALILLDRLFES